MRMPYAYFMLIELKVDKDMRNTAIFRQLAMVVTLHVCVLKVALAVVSMERTADWVKGRGPQRAMFPTLHV